MNTKYVEFLFELHSGTLAIWRTHLHRCKERPTEIPTGDVFDWGFYGCFTSIKILQKVSQVISWGDVHIIFLPGYVNNPIKSSLGSNWIKESFHLKEIWWQNLLALGNPAEKVKVPGSKEIVPATGHKLIRFVYTKKKKCTTREEAA